VTDTALTPFHYGDERLRAYEDEKGMAWFIAADVARILGHRDAANTIKGVDEDERGTTIVSTPGGEQTLSTISEAGLVTVLMRARVEAATPFRRWVTHEVLPSIRRTGSYSRPGVMPVPSAENPALVRAKGLMELVALAKDVISPDYLEAKARIVLARAMGDTPEIEASARPLYVQDYMREQGVSSDNIKSYAPTFGKYVKKAYKAERGVEPGKRFDETPSGQVREVCVYTEADRPIFDCAWSESYAKGFPEKREAKKNKEKK
jgi:prophage antirepressor-like protein